MPRFQYRLADHLGNTVVFFEDKNSDGCIKTEEQATSQADLEIVQRLLYYPFGMALEGIGAWNAQPWQQYRYNGKERDTLTGWYDYGARWGLLDIGRWNAVDPLAGHPNQVDKSPYAYSWNNPVLLNDPDGRCPHCLPALATRAISGFIAGAAIDYGMQVAGNMVFGGQDLPSAMTNVSGRSILISGGAGALSGGMAAPVNATRTVMVKHFAINLGIDVAESTAKQLSGDDKSWTIVQTISDVTMSRAAGGLTSGIKGPVNTSTSSYVYRNADRTARIMALFRCLQTTC